MLSVINIAIRPQRSSACRSLMIAAAGSIAGSKRRIVSHLNVASTNTPLSSSSSSSSSATPNSYCSRCALLMTSNSSTLESSADSKKTRIEVMSSKIVENLNSGNTTLLPEISSVIKAELPTSDTSISIGASMSESALSSYLSKLDLFPPGVSRCLPIGSEYFPLIMQRDPIIDVMKSWLANSSVEAISEREKRVLPMTSAPAGAGKSTFLYILCQLFSHKWDVSKFMEAHIYKRKCGEELEGDIIQTMTSILNDPTIKKLKNSTELSNSLFESTHPCYIGFKSESPVQDYELEAFGSDPQRIIISRVIFAHTRMNKDSTRNWEHEYSDFFIRNRASIKKIGSLKEVLLFFRNRNGCKHFLLAINGLHKLDEGLKCKRTKSSRVQSVMRAIANTVIPTDGIHTIISTFTTNPINEFSNSSQYTPYFVRLPLLLQNLDHLSRFLATKCFSGSTDETILQFLLSTGGHPWLISRLIPWFCVAPRDEMNFEFAADYIELNISWIDAFSDSLQRLIFTAGCIPSNCITDIIDISCSGGFMFRPSNYNSTYSAVVPPLVLYTYALHSSKYFCRRSDAGFLVPFRLSCDDDFGKFIASWFAFQFKLGRSLNSIFDDKPNPCLSYTELSKLSNQTRLFEFRNKTAFIDSLPKVEFPSVELILQTTDSIDNLFGLATPSAGGRVLFIEEPNNLGFDVMISVCTPLNNVKKVLLIQCKTKIVATLIEERMKDEGPTVNSETFADALIVCSDFVKTLESNSWEVSFLGLYSCNTPESVIPVSCPSGVSSTFFERSAAIGNSSVHDLLGGSFGLALEFAKEGRLNQINFNQTYAE